MTLGIDQAAKQLKIQNALKLLKNLQEPVDYKLTAPDPILINVALQRIPWLSRMLQDVESSGAAIIKIGEHTIELPDAPSNEALGHMFHFGSIALAGFDFVRIPIVYLAAFILEQKIPFNIDNNARWFYSALLFGLIILSLVVPVTAPIIAFVAAGMGIVASAFLLTRIFVDRYVFGLEKESTWELIAKGHVTMEAIQKQASALETRLHASSEEFDLINAEIERLHKNYMVQKARLENLKVQARDIEKNIKDAGFMRILDKSIAIILGGITVIGLILAIHLPIGLTIISATSVIGSVYVLGRVAMPFVQAFVSWVERKIVAFANSNTKNFVADDQHKPSLAAQVTNKPDVAAQSTANTDAPTNPTSSQHATKEPVANVPSQASSYFSWFSSKKKEPPSAAEEQDQDKARPH